MHLKGKLLKTDGLIYNKV